MRGTELTIIAILVLVVGLTSAGIVYVTADEKDEAAMEQIYNSKQYQRQLQQFGGKASVVFDDIRRWFDARWHGKQLGVTIGWISVAVAFGFYLAGRYRK